MPIDTTRTLVAVFLAEEAPAHRGHGRSSGVMIRVSTGAFWRMKSFTSRSMRDNSSADSALEWLKSKRSRSGALSEPRCAT